MKLAFMGMNWNQGHDIFVFLQIHGMVEKSLNGSHGILMAMIFSFMPMKLRWYKDTHISLDLVSFHGNEIVNLAKIHGIFMGYSSDNYIPMKEHPKKIIGWFMGKKKDSWEFHRNFMVFSWIICTVVLYNVLGIRILVLRCPPLNLIYEVTSNLQCLL